MAAEQDQMDKVILFFFCVILAGCATTRQSSSGPDTVAAQVEAARKVVGAMAPAASRDAVEKYSPVTGRHYSGALEYEPGTGAKLIPVEE